MQYSFSTLVLELDDGGEFLKEALVMKDFDHTNVLTLIGVCLDGEEGLPNVIIPFMANGDLHSYLRKEEVQPGPAQLLDLAIQIAQGMEYLHNLKFVHRDLAARNCMLDENLVVKVADFGLSRDVYEKSYYKADLSKAALPVKWMAIESLQIGTFNVKTDVWSYGILLWELFTKGAVPYPMVNNWEILPFLNTGRRMEKPYTCPMAFFRIMATCWLESPKQRPTFSSILEDLGKLKTCIEEVIVIRNESGYVVRE